MRKQLGRALLKAAASLSAGALVILMGLEGFRAMPYQDQAGVWTDGFGNTASVVPGKPVTVDKAKADLQRHVNAFDRTIMSCLKNGVSQGQYDAYLLLAYNIGGGAFCKSSIVREHNRGNYMQACSNMMRYNKIRINGVLTASRGLSNRRYTEYNICLSGLKE